MSKPTPNYFCVHTGYFRNDRTLALREKIGDHAFYVMPMLWSWAGESQMDGNVGHLTNRRFQEIFEGCHLKLKPGEVVKIIDAIREVGFIKNGRLHSWEKYNRQFFEFDRRREIKRLAAFARWEQRVTAQAPRPRIANGNGKPEASDKDKPEPNGQRPSQQLWMIEQALKSAKGKARKALEVQREELLSEHTGVDLSEPKPAPAAPASPRPKPISASAWDRTCLANGRQLLKAEQGDLLTEAMVKALHKAGDTLPESVRTGKHRKLITELDEAANPVPA